MKFTFNWLKESVAYSSTPERLAELLTMAGLEVESLTSLRELETERQDWLFEIAVTPNRGDCLGIAGIAREVAALTGNELRALPESPADKDSAIKKRISIKIEDAQLCARYSARIVEDVRVAPSPAWLRRVCHRRPCVVIPSSLPPCPRRGFQVHHIANETNIDQYDEPSRHRRLAVRPRRGRRSGNTPAT